MKDEDLDFTIRLVDGTEVRNNLFTDFTQAGHGYVYSFIPKDEIWLEAWLPPEDMLHALRHEIRERALMKRGMKYDEAHKIVTKLECQERGGEAENDKAYTKNAMEKKAFPVYNPLQTAQHLRRLKSIRRIHPLQHTLQIDTLTKRLEEFKKNPLLYSLKTKLSAPFKDIPQFFNPALRTHI